MDIIENKIQFIDEGNQDLLIEFPPATVPSFAESLFFEIQKTEVTPVIVHLERNWAILNDTNELLSLVENRALAQLTVGSNVGSFGKNIQKLSKQLIEADLVHLNAPDAHNTTTRSFI